MKDKNTVGSVSAWEILLKRWELNDRLPKYNERKICLKFLLEFYGFII